MKPRAEGLLTRRARLVALLSSFGALLATLLLPKCPLCWMATLSALGLGASGASLFVWAAQPLTIGWFALSLLLWLGLGLRRARG